MEGDGTFSALDRRDGDGRGDPILGQSQTTAGQDRSMDSGSDIAGEIERLCTNGDCIKGDV